MTKIIREVDETYVEHSRYIFMLRLLVNVLEVLCQFVVLIYIEPNGLWLAMVCEPGIFHLFEHIVNSHLELAKLTLYTLHIKRG